MISRKPRQVTIECDSCPETFAGELDEEFTIVWESAKREGWRTRKIANEWLHGCPNCGVPT